MQWATAVGLEEMLQKKKTENRRRTEKPITEPLLLPMEQRVEKANSTGSSNLLICKEENMDHIYS